MIEGLPSATGITICLVIPCYNEAHRLKAAEFHNFLGTSQTTFLLFVDDGSSDNTFSILQEMCNNYGAHATVLRNDRNKGKAETVRTGINYALSKLAPDVIGFWDADLATPLSAVPNLLSVLEGHATAEMVFGSRIKLLGRHVERRPIRHYLGRVFATVVSILLRLPIYDSQCGAKLFRVDSATTEVFAAPFLSRWVFDVEILARYLKIYNNDANYLREIIFEYPLETWVDVAGSKVRPADFVRAALDLLRIWRAYL